MTFDTYSEALTQLISRLRELKAQGVSHNRLSTTTGLSFQTITKIIAGETKPNCPWQLLRSLDQPATA